MGNQRPLQGAFLEILCNQKISVSVYLINGIKLQGEIESFDDAVILLKNSFKQIIYKHAISTVVPAKEISLNRLMFDEEPSKEEVTS